MCLGAPTSPVLTLESTEQPAMGPESFSQRISSLHVLERVNHSSQKSDVKDSTDIFFVFAAEHSGPWVGGAAGLGLLVWSQPRSGFLNT